MFAAHCMDTLLSGAVLLRQSFPAENLDGSVGLQVSLGWKRRLQCVACHNSFHYGIIRFIVRNKGMGPVSDTDGDSSGKRMVNVAHFLTGADPGVRLDDG